MPDVALVRHCESSGQAPEAPLTAAGQAQALMLAQRLAALGVDYIVSSPYARARATIQPFASQAGLSVDVDDRLAERRLAAQPIDGWREVVRRSFEDLDACLPGGESGRETLARGWAAIDAVVALDHRLPIVVSHGQLLSLVLHSIDPSFGYAGWERLANPDLFILEQRGSTFTFKRP
jgi:2,3-bisphosphoglycerate-dependent phosphoglycerate mutase